MWLPLFTSSVRLSSQPYTPTCSDAYACTSVCVLLNINVYIHTHPVCVDLRSPLGVCTVITPVPSMPLSVSSSPKPPLLVHCPVIYFSADRKPFDSADSLCSVGGPFEKSLYFFRVLFASGSKNPRLPQSVAKLVVTESSFSKKHSRLPPDS